MIALRQDVEAANAALSNHEGSEEEYQNAVVKLDEAKKNYDHGVQLRIEELNQNILDAENAPDALITKQAKELKAVLEKAEADIAAAEAFENSLQDKYDLDLESVVEMTPADIREFTRK